MPILDAQGRPINTDRLQEELGRASISSIRNVFTQSIARGLTPERLGSLLRQVDEGSDPRDYLALAEEMEERDPHYRSVISTRKMAVQSLPTMVAAGDPDDTKSVEIQEATQRMIDAPIFRVALGNLLDALAKGYSVVEIIWRRDAEAWDPIAYKWRDPRFFRFDQDAGQTIGLISNDAPAFGVPLEPCKFIVHRPHLKSGLPIRGGLARVEAALHLYKGYALNDWMSFAEVFGLPLRVGKYDPNQSEPSDIDTLKTAVANIGTDAAATIPKSMDLEFVDSSSTSGDGGGLFVVLENWLDKQTSKLVLGQTMTTDDGSSRAQAIVHDSVRGDIMESDAADLSDTINRDLVRPWVDLNFGPQEVYPTFKLAIERAEDLESLSKALTPFIDRGLRVEAAEIRDKFKLQEPADDAEVLEPQGGGGGLPGTETAALAAIGETRGESDIIGEIGEQFDDEWREVLNPLVEPIARLAETVSTYSEFKRKLPGVLKAVASDPIVQRIATMNFEARGVGDATDSIR
jgi:phage gp29-like protein